MSIICKRFFISGHVQGVFFRASTQEQAIALQLTGFAKNLSDGRVEVLACGEEKQVQLLEDWLWQGPTAANVDSVTGEVVDDVPVVTHFETG